MHVISDLKVAGAQVQLRSVLRYSRHECHVIALNKPEPIGAILRDDGIQVRDLAMSSSMQLSALPRLWHLMRHGQYDVAHVHAYRSQVYGRPAARLAGIPVVISTEHSIGETHIEGRRKTTGLRALHLGTGLFSDMTIAVTPVVRDRLLDWGISDRKLTVIPNGVDLERVAFDITARAQIRAEFGIGAGDYVIGTLGRLDSNKQFHLVIEASAPLLRTGVTLLIVGAGDERVRLQETAERCGIACNVVFAGERNDVGAMLSAMDLFVAPSREETFGLSVVEALANGVPVLYTTCPALDGLDVRQARKIPGTVKGIYDALVSEISAGPRKRRPEPTVQLQYNAQAVAARIDELYERLTARRSSLRKSWTATPASRMAGRRP